MGGTEDAASRRPARPSGSRLHFETSSYGFVAQPVELPPLKRRVAGSTPAGAIWKDCHRCGIRSRKPVGLRALGVRLPLLPLFRCGRAARRATVNREAQVRSLPPEPLASVVDG